jgi:hypothetical protein
LEERIRAKEIKKYNYIDKIVLDSIRIPQSAMRPSLYRPGVVFPELESCCPENKGFRDKIRLDLNLPVISWARQSDRAPEAIRPPASGYAGSA